MIAYNKEKIENLQLVKEVKQFFKSGFVSAEQYKAIEAAHPAQLYHPNFIIRMLLFIASLIALGGVTGILGLIFAEAMNESVLILAFFYGIGCFFVLEIMFIRNANHYKSGVNEALLYHSIGWTMGGFAYMVDGNEYSILLTVVALLIFCSIRYADLLCTAGALLTFAYLIFKICNAMGGAMQFVVPFVLIIIFTPAYFIFKQMKSKQEMQVWNTGLLLAESISLLLIYCAGNYFIVRNTMESMMGIYLQQGQDIPYALLFYILTAVIPAIYLYFGIKRKDIVLIRVSLVVLAFSAFTFKYYFSLGHPEITLTIAGAILITVALSLFRYLRTNRNGYTRDNILKEKWAGANPEAFVISQTLGGNKMPEVEHMDMGGGGHSGGGGSSDGW